MELERPRLIGVRVAGVVARGSHRGRRARERLHLLPQKEGKEKEEEEEGGGGVMTPTPAPARLRLVYRFHSRRWKKPLRERHGA